MKTAIASLKAVLVFSAITGVAYPLLMTVIGEVAFPRQARGSLVKRGDVVVGSDLIAQKPPEKGYFQPRPSAADYSTVASGASNLGPTNKVLLESVQKRRSLLGPDAPVDLLTTSGSGIDPHLSPQGALFQVQRVATERGFSPEQQILLRAKVQEFVETPTFGLLGQNRVNVRRLNEMLDDLVAKTRP